MSGEEHVPAAPELSKEVAAWRCDVAVVWAGNTYLARLWRVSALKRACEDARNEREKEEEGSLEEHVGSMSMGF